MFFIDLETERLILKNISMDDREFVFSHFSDSEVNKYLFDTETVTDMQGADEIVEFYLKPEPRSWHRWVIIRKDDGMKMGTCGVHLWDQKEHKVEVGYDLSKEFWGKGYMQEAMKEVISFATDKMKVKEITACIYVDNERSMNLAENLGFVLKDTNYELYRNKKYLHHKYSLCIQ